MYLFFQSFVKYFVSYSTPFFRSLSPTIDYSFTLGLGVILAIKYIFFDGEIDIECELERKQAHKSTTVANQTNASFVPDDNNTRGDNQHLNTDSSLPSDQCTDKGNFFYLF